jgi:hypothetical protein
LHLSFKNNFFFFPPKFKPVAGSYILSLLLRPCSLVCNQ